MKQLKLFVIFLITFIFTACAPKYVLESREKRTPLSLDDKVRIVLANDIPVIPENSSSIATMRIDPNLFKYNPDKALDIIITRSRQIGANFIYIKDCQSQNTVYVEFLEVK